MEQHEFCCFIVDRFLFLSHSISNVTKQSTICSWRIMLVLSFIGFMNVLLVEYELNYCHMLMVALPHGMMLLNHHMFFVA